MLPPPSHFLNREQVIQQISTAKSYKNFPTEKTLKALADPEIYQLASQKIHELCAEQILRCSTYPKDISNEALKQNIAKKIDPNFFMIVKVRTVKSHLFESGLKKAREIQLARENWSSVNAFFVWEKDKKQLKNFYLMHGILKSSQFMNDPLMKQEYSDQLKSAYLQGYKITIIVPFNFDEEGEIKISALGD